MIFIDIETVPETNDYSTYNKAPQREEKYSNDKGDLSFEEWYKKRSSLYAEFAKIVCISIGRETESGFKTSSLFGDNEKELLTKFNSVINADEVFVGHNIKSFDIPFLWKRSIMNGITPTKAISATGKKPRELVHVDTMELWKQTM
jgi:3'-5' exonuclease